VIDYSVMRSAFLIIMLFLLSSAFAFAALMAGIDVGLARNVTGELAFQSGVSLQTKRLDFSATFSKEKAQYYMRYDLVSHRTFRLQGDAYLNSSAGAVLAASLGQSLRGKVVGFDYQIGVQTSLMLFLPVNFKILLSPFVRFVLWISPFKMAEFYISAGTATFGKLDIQMSPVFSAGFGFDIDDIRLVGSFSVGLSEFWWEQVTVSFDRVFISLMVRMEDAE
jgi:hypothetical protein